MAKPISRTSDDMKFNIAVRATRRGNLHRPAMIDGDRFQPTRRGFMAILGMGLLTGCAQQAVTSSLPGPLWPNAGIDDPLPAPSPQPAASPSSSMPGVLARNTWARDRATPSLMNRMLPVRHITVHHDGMKPFFASDTASSAARLEAIRRAHRNRGWGDIGYHFAVDRDGRVWQGRELAWQGAHVKDHNEGNIGIVCLGNFDLQSPSPKQVAALQQHIARLMKQYRVPSARILTHQEWPGAATACPGRNLQSFVVSARRSGRFA